MGSRGLIWVAQLPRMQTAFSVLSRNQILPKRLFQTDSSQNPVKLLREGSTVHLLGTMHIAEASAVAARDLIRREHAKGHLGAVFLELDAGRFERLKKSSRERADESLLTHAMNILRRPNSSTLTSLVELGLTTAYRTLHKMGFASGVEFVAAMETADGLNIPIVLGDQEVRVTLSRLAEGFRSDFDVSRLMALAVAHTAFPNGKSETPTERRVREAFQSIASGDVARGQERLAKLIDRDTVRQIMQPMRDYAPNVTKAILDERDIVMTENLIKAVEGLPIGKRNLVAVVGLAHVEGIAKAWDRKHQHLDIEPS